MQALRSNCGHPLPCCEDFSPWVLFDLFVSQVSWLLFRPELCSWALQLAASNTITGKESNQHSSKRRGHEDVEDTGSDNNISYFHVHFLQLALPRNSFCRARTVLCKWMTKEYNGKVQWTCWASDAGKYGNQWSPPCANFLEEIVL